MDISDKKQLDSIEVDLEEEDVDPIIDIVDYLVRCAKVSFKNAHVDEKEIRKRDKVRLACDLFKKSPIDFLLQFGKYLAPQHLRYFEDYQPEYNVEKYSECIKQLKQYHSEETTHKRIRNRRYHALQKLQKETDYFTEKQMMYRSPLLYDQLVGQYLNENEIKERDGVDRDNLTFLSLILETVDRNQMKEMKNEQMIAEDMEGINLTGAEVSSVKNNKEQSQTRTQWGEFETSSTKPSYIPEPKTQNVISAPERRLLREEFLQEMYSSFMEGRDTDIDYTTIDNEEQYDDLKQVSQDAEDRYFDSELNDTENLEEHMKLVSEYGRKKCNDSNCDDPLDTFMTHLNKRHIES